MSTTQEPTCTGCGHPRSHAIKAVIEGCIACCPDCDVLRMGDRNLIREVVVLTELSAMREAITEAQGLIEWLINNSSGLLHRTATEALAKLQPLVPSTR